MGAPSAMGQANELASVRRGPGAVQARYANKAARRLLGRSTTPPGLVGWTPQQRIKKHWEGRVGH
jgi:hypothetical protein